jgi:hypothetical protein
MVDIVDLRNLVAEAEGTTDAKASQENFASGYEVPFAYGQYLQPSKPISQMTFKELDDFQKKQINATKGIFDNTNRGTSAVGRYQFIRGTLQGLKDRLGYKDTDIFSQEVQDRLFDALMEEQGLQDLLSGLITPEEFQTKLSSQFASIPKPGTETGTYKGQNTGVTSDRVSAVLSSMQADTQTDKMLSEEQPGSTFRSEDDTVPSDTGTVTGDQAEEEPGFLDTVGEYVGDAYNTASEYVGETVDTLERVAESVGEKLRRLLGSEEEQQSSSSDDNPPLPTLRPDQAKKSSFNVMDGAEALYSLATTGSRESARKLRDMVAQQLGVYESSQEATSEAKKYGLNEREVDTLRHILGAGLLKYIGKDFTQPLLQGTELFEKIPIYAQRLLDPDSEDKYRKSYYDQSIEEANIDIVNYQVGAALANQYDTKDDFIKSAVELVKDLGKGKTPVVVDNMPTEFGLIPIELTPRLSTGVVYPPEELKRRNVIYNPDKGTLTAPPVEDYGFVEPAPGSNLEDQGPAVLEKAEGGSVEKKAEFIKKDDDDDVPDPPPGATPEEVADDIPAYLSTGEYVLPANVVRYIGLKNITGMHQRALSELQQMEDLDIIENVDENGYVEEDDDEMDYMKPEGVVEIVVAEHHPKGLMAMGFAEGGPVEAMVYVPGVGFVPQTQAAYLSDTKDKDEKPKEQEDTDKNILEGGESQGDTNDTSEGGTTGKGYGSFSEMVNDPSFQSQAKAVTSLFGTPLAVDIATGALKGFKDQFGLAENDAPSPGEAFGGDVESMGIGGTPAAAQAAAASQMDAQAAENEAAAEAAAEAAEAAAAESEAEADAEAGELKRGGYVTRNGIMARGYSEGGMINSDSSIEEGQVLPTSDIFSEGVYAQADINRSVDSENVVESDKVITAPVAFSSAPGKTAYLAYITPEEAASLRQAKQGFSSEGNGQEVSDGQYQHLGPKGLMSFNGEGGTSGTSEGGMGGRGGGVGGAGSGSPTGGASGPSASESYGGAEAGDEGGGMGGPGGTDEYRFDEVEPEVEEKPTDPYEGYTYVKGIGYVPTSRRATSNKPIESASVALSSIFTPGFLANIGLMSDPNKEL